MIISLLLFIACEKNDRYIQRDVPTDVELSDQEIEYIQDASFESNQSDIK